MAIEIRRGNLERRAVLSVSVFDPVPVFGLPRAICEINATHKNRPKMGGWEKCAEGAALLHPKYIYVKYLDENLLTLQTLSDVLQSALRS